MNSIRQIQELNKRELENNVPPSASWHTDYRDTAYIYIGGLPFELSEGDIITIFSQFGEPTYINLIRDKETGKSKGFAFLKYEDQRSTDLAVDNLGGAVIMGRTLKVDHTRYKKKDDEEEEGQHLGGEAEGHGSEEESEEERPMLREEMELAKLIKEHDEDDPMKGFLVQEKKEEVAMALARVKGGKGEGKSEERKHKHRHHHRSRRDGEEKERRRPHHREDSRERKRSRSQDAAPREDMVKRLKPERRSEEINGRRRDSRRDSRERTRKSQDRDDMQPRRRRDEPPDERSRPLRR